MDVDLSTTSEREGANQRRPLVFLDTNVILSYLGGDASTSQIFSADASGRIRLAINSIVLQELLLSAGAAKNVEFDRIRENLRILPVDAAKAETFISRVRAFRNHLVHSNDVLILSSADDCDYLVTRDRGMKELVKGGKPQVVTPEELASYLRAA